MPDKKEIRCLVVDDEPLAGGLIADYISRTPGLVLARQFTNPLEALPWILEDKADLLFLDIQMPELSGLQLLKLIRGRCKAVLITAYPNYALEGYEHDVIDYLLKPVTLERFLQSAQKIRDRMTTRAEVRTADDFLFVKTEYKIQKVNLAEVWYLEGLRDYVALHTAAGKILSLQPLRTFEERLPAQAFVRIHKSYIVSIRHIRFLEKSRVVIGEHYLPIGDTYREGLLRALEVL
ncbi:MAG TPA: LytTR family DNA-binding domain-containing protein [Chitinophagaceae bacterium]|jgi:DNA-binding LytR/AlgR family response regulator|nr:LytTR family DNA-binding domain-containing protein [Chitinophagaceae bacterium]